MGCSVSRTACRPSLASPVSRTAPSMVEEPQDQGASIFTDPKFVELSSRIGQGLRRNAPVRLMRGEYLIEIWRSGGILLRRQDLPDEAFYDGPLDVPGIQIIVVSYPWLTPEHPDPRGFHLNALGAFLRDQKNMAPDGPTVVFIDFCSLYQVLRSDAEEDLFKLGLKGINLLYAHEHTSVWCLTRVPSESMVSSYFDRGWCTFERIISSALKNRATARVLDIGKLTSEELTDMIDQPMDANHTRDAWSWLARGSRVPPLTKAAFELLLQTKTFTNGNTDHELVAGLYGSFLDQALPALQNAEWDALGWNDDDAEQLAKVLPMCKRLRRLNLASNGFYNRGLIALASALPPCVEVLNLSRSDGGDDAYCKALATHMPLSVCTLILDWGEISCPLRQANTRQDVETFVRFYLGDADVRSAIAAEVHAAEEAAAKARETGPPELEIGGVRYRRRIECIDAADLGNYGFAGAWYLSRNQPLINDAPHYDHESASGRHWHLYRYVNPSSAAAVWRIGPEAGGFQSAAATYITDTLNPLELRSWRVNTRDGLKPGVLHFRAGCGEVEEE